MKRPAPDEGAGPVTTGGQEDNPNHDPEKTDAAIRTFSAACFKLLRCSGGLKSARASMAVAAASEQWGLEGDHFTADGRQLNWSLSATIAEILEERERARNDLQASVKQLLEVELNPSQWPGPVRGLRCQAAPRLGAEEMRGLPGSVAVLGWSEPAPDRHRPLLRLGGASSDSAPERVPLQALRLLSSPGPVKAVCGASGRPDYCVPNPPAERGGPAARTADACCKLGSGLSGVPG